MLSNEVKVTNGMLRNKFTEDGDEESFYGINAEFTRGTSGVWMAKANYNGKPYESTGVTREDAANNLIKKIHTAEGTVDSERSDIEKEITKLEQNLRQEKRMIQQRESAHMSQEDRDEAARHKKNVVELEERIKDLKDDLYTAKDSKMKDGGYARGVYKGYELMEDTVGKWYIFKNGNLVNSFGSERETKRAIDNGTEKEKNKFSPYNRSK